MGPSFVPGNIGKVPTISELFKGLRKYLNKKKAMAPNYGNKRKS